MNILICTTQVPFTSGGAESHVTGLRDAFLAAGQNAEIVALPFKWYPPSEIMRSALAWRMLDLSEANGKRIDLVVGMKFPAYLVGHENKVLWVMHQYRAAYNLWNTPFDDLSTYPDGAQVREWVHQVDNELIPKAKKVFANSKTVAERLQRYNKIASEPLYHPPPRAELLHEGGQGDYVFYPSRLEPQKRQELLIEAAKYLKSPLKIVFSGGSGDAGRYKDLAKKNRVSDRVCFRGFVSENEVVELYANAFAVCYLPFDEDYGYVTLEGMLSGKPVVAPADGGGATEFIENGLEGFVVEPTPQAIATALDSLYSDRTAASAMGRRGREKLTSMKLSWEHVVEKLLDAAR